jgi:hypothetical protein
MFDTIYAGTLYGRWPMAPVWASLLPLVNAYGEIDLSFEAIAGMTGWPMELLRHGIAQLCEPDPYSRSEAEDGRRLVPLDDRGWGWRVVNHAHYREKARLAVKAAREVASGLNAQRMRDRRRPPETPGTPPSNADEEHDRIAGRSTPRGERIPFNDLSQVLTSEVVAWARGNAPHIKIDEAVVQFVDHWRCVRGARGRKLDWGAAFRNYLRKLAHSCD